MALIERVEQQADGDLVREMLAFAAERIMEARWRRGPARPRARERRCGKCSATETATATGIHRSHLLLDAQKPTFASRLQQFVG